MKQYTYKHAPTIKAFSKDNTFMRAIMGPFGSGKTSGAGAIECYNRALAQEPGPDGVRRTKFAAVRNSFPQLRDTTVPTFLYWLGELGNYKSSEYDFYLKTEHPVDHSPVESIICFRALDRPQDIKNLLSVEYTGAFFNEGKEISKNIIDAMGGRVNRYPPKNSDGTGGATWSGIWMDTNPPDVDSWFYKLFEVDKPTKCVKCRTAIGGFILMDKGYCPVCKGTDGIPLAVIYKQPSGMSAEAENLPFLGTDYYATLAAGKDQDFINVYVHGQYGYVRDGKPVFPNFDSTWHQSKEQLKAIPGYPIILAFDNTGMNQGCVACQYLPSGQFVILHEWLFPDMGTRRLARDHVKPFIFNHYPGAQLYITHDPAGIKRSDSDERTSVMELLEAFLVQPFPARSNALQARFNAVDTLLTKRIQGGQPSLLVSSACPMILHGFMGEYRYRRLQVMGRERYVDKPEKNMVANLMDAVQYACMFVEDMFDLMAQNRSAQDSHVVIPTEELWNAFT